MFNNTTVERRVYGVLEDPQHTAAFIREACDFSSGISSRSKAPVDSINKTSDLNSSQTNIQSTQ